MAVRGFVSFDAQFSRDPIEGDDEELPPGRDLMECIAAGIKVRDTRITEVSQHDSYGWYFEVQLLDKTIWCMLQLSDNWLLITRPNESYWKRLFKKDVAEREHHHVCQAIDKVLQGDHRFSSVRWFTEEEFQSRGGGVEHP